MPILWRVLQSLLWIFLKCDQNVQWEMFQSIANITFLQNSCLIFVIGFSYFQVSSKPTHEIRSWNISWPRVMDIWSQIQNAIWVICWRALLACFHEWIWTPWAVAGWWCDGWLIMWNRFDIPSEEMDLEENAKSTLLYFMPPIFFCIILWGSRNITEGNEMIVKRQSHLWRHGIFSFFKWELVLC